MYLYIVSTQYLPTQCPSGLDVLSVFQYLDNRALGCSLCFSALMSLGIQDFSLALASREPLSPYLYRHFPDSLSPAKPNN